MECFSAPEYMVNTHNFSHVGSWYVVLEVPFHFLSKKQKITLQQRAAALIDTLWHEGLMDELTASSEASWRRGRHTLFEVWKRRREGDGGRAAEGPTWWPARLAALTRSSSWIVFPPGRPLNWIRTQMFFSSLNWMPTVSSLQADRYRHSIEDS